MYKLWGIIACQYTDFKIWKNTYTTILNYQPAYLSAQNIVLDSLPTYNFMIL